MSIYNKKKESFNLHNIQYVFGYYFIFYVFHGFDIFVLHFPLKRSI